MLEIGELEFNFTFLKEEQLSSAMTVRIPRFCSLTNFISWLVAVKVLHTTTSSFSVTLRDAIFHELDKGDRRTKIILACLTVSYQK